MSEDVGVSDSVFKLYEDGKHRRYDLLFAVNGGAFAIAKLLAKEDPHSAEHLTPLALSVGMILFTIVMVWDIYCFGVKMQDGRGQIFTWVGKTVLILLGLLICIGWGLAAWPQSA